jgi:hypothetical protein
MNLQKFVQSRIAKVRCRQAIGRLAASARKPNLADWTRSLKDPTAFYEDCVIAFYRELPEALREHRRYFSENKRGFGEDAFHTMWRLLMERFRFRKFLEIGVYRGQTLSLVSMLQREFGVTDGEVWGVSPFASVGDSVSRYKEDVDYLTDTKSNFQHFDLHEPKLLKAYSTDLAAVELIGSKSWDAIYIDGNHDYEIVRGDWDNCAASVKSGGIIVLDDSSLNTSFEAPVFATKGHPGPSRLAEEIDRARFEEILRVGHNRVFQKK